MKILVISQHLYPMQTPRAHRTTELVKELGRQGHEVTLYAVIGKHDYSSFKKEFNVTVKNIPLKWMVHPYNSDNDKRRTLVDKILGRLFKKLEFPNIEFMFRIPNILKKDHDYDALITIADPHQIHWGVARVRKKNPQYVPKVWIADCGDPFMLNGSISGHLNFFEKFERLFCSTCDVITVPVEEAKLGYFQEYRCKIEVIPQGFKFLLPERNVKANNLIPTFAYAGVFYKDIRNPENFMNFISSLDKEFKFIVYTPHSSLLDRFKKILGDKLEIKEPIIRDELINELRKMDFLVNFENSNSPAQIPSKLIDYGIAGPPVLTVDCISLNTNSIIEFFEGNYTSRFDLPDLDRYRIENVTNQFIKIINSSL